jgi:Uma2 family endonuclease
MSIGLPPLKLTYEDYLYLPEDGKRHELIDGEHYVTPAPTTKHQAISFNLSVLLGSFLRDSKTGRLFAAPFDVVLSDTDVVQPDLVYISTKRSAILTEANLQGAPDLAIEILSPGTRRTDLVTKRHLYEKFGVQEYWVVDPEIETVQVHRLRDGRYERHELAAGEALTSALFPGLSLPLAEIFA